MKTIFIGPLGGGSVPANGASVKNYYLYSKIKELVGGSVSAIDTEQWRNHPKSLIKLLWKVLLNQGSQVIISVSNDSALGILKLLKLVNPKAKIFYWVIGGSLGKQIKEGKKPLEIYKRASRIIVEGETMKADMVSAGLENVSVMPNFKILPPDIIKVARKKNNAQTKTRFVFLSRIAPYKGTDDIVKVAALLNESGYKSKFEIDFYGPFEPGYKEEFLTSASKCGNVFYKGFIDLRDSRNYKILSEYDTLLFPTYWESEGCPGIIIDACFAGLPIIASDWNLNSDYVKDEVTGFLVPPRDLSSLQEKMSDIINGKVDIDKMRSNSLKEAGNFHIDRIINQETLKEIGMQLCQRRKH